jgi:uncharacterized protein (DUF362 family)
VKGGSAEDRVAKALSLLRASQHLDLRPDSKIVVKPNLGRVPAESPYAKAKGAYELTTLMSKTGEGDITTPEAIRGVIKALRDIGFDDVTIAEAAGGCFTDLVYKALDIYGLAAEYDVKVADLNWEDSVKFSIPNRTTLDYAWIPRTVLEADLLVSVPAWKCWGDHVTLGLKNIGIGVLPGKYYGWNRAGRYVHGLDPNTIHNPVLRARLGFKWGQSIAVAGEVVDVCSVAPPGLTVLDGTYVLQGDGTATRADTTFAGYDPVAVSTIAIEAMGLNPQRIVKINLATQRGLGTSDLSKIEVRGRAVDDVTIRVAPPKNNKRLLKT